MAGDVGSPGVVVKPRSRMSWWLLKVVLSCSGCPCHAQFVGSVDNSGWRDLSIAESSFPLIPATASRSDQATSGFCPVWSWNPVKMKCTQPLLTAHWHLLCIFHWHWGCFFVPPKLSSPLSLDTGRVFQPPIPVVLPCAPSSSLVTFLHCGANTWIQYSRNALLKAE